MEPGKQYKNPPLVEVVFELFFNSKDWQPIVPILFYDKIKTVLPKVGQNSAVNIELNKKSLRLLGGNENIYQYKSNDGSTLVQLSDRLFTVNKLPPYHGWESFYNTIKIAYSFFKEIMPEVDIEKVGFRTINKIDVGDHNLGKIKEHFNYYPVLPENVDNNTSSVDLRVENSIVPNEEVLALKLQTIKQEPGYVAPVLFQYYVLRIEKVPNDVMGWVSNAHSVVRETFSKSLTNHSKQKFDEQ
ncbi:TIGR04255 family protein [Maribellus comscasis]|uniref:TIGR04255 family protein n=1 Tax=Maribellus comscasis TaxID=2681766 RepID=A0A6I6JMH9_9BACT|nr:TIGR04255 family protein [Maribellus comscasis]QGY44126.1 TIGR04255 family protein [Maribellus comscasis]